MSNLTVKSPVQSASLQPHSVLCLLQLGAAVLLPLNSCVRDLRVDYSVYLYMPVNNSEHVGLCHGQLSDNTLRVMLWSETVCIFDLNYAVLIFIASSMERSWEIIKKNKPLHIVECCHHEEKPGHVSLIKCFSHCGNIFPDATATKSDNDSLFNLNSFNWQSRNRGKPQILSSLWHEIAGKQMWIQYSCNIVASDRN